MNKPSSKTKRKESRQKKRREEWDVSANNRSASMSMPGHNCKKGTGGKNGVAWRKKGGGVGDGIGKLI